MIVLLVTIIWIVVVVVQRVKMEVVLIWSVCLFNLYFVTNDFIILLIQYRMSTRQCIQQVRQ
jgi:hypothetical protein